MDLIQPMQLALKGTYLQVFYQILTLFQWHSWHWKIIKVEILMQIFFYFLTALSYFDQYLLLFIPFSNSTYDNHLLETQKQLTWNNVHGKWITTLDCAYSHIFIVSTLLIVVNPILPGLWKDIVTRGGHYGPPLFFCLWGHQKPKTKPWHIFGTKNYLKSHFEHF